MPTFTISGEHSIEASIRATRQEKEIKVIQIVKEEAKSSLCTDDMQKIVCRKKMYIENSKEST